jgi:thioredoxin 1
MSENTLNLTQNNFKETLEENPIVLVDFWATWCNPCKMIAPVVEELANDYSGKITVGKLNVDENNALSTEYGVMSIPTLLIFKKGKEVERIVGYKAKAEIAKTIDKVLQ